jgi:RNA polymerase sigma-70 factor (ECF subfamily)
LSQVRAKAERFVELLQPLQKPLEVYCRRLLRNRAPVEDTLQSAVAAAFAAFDRHAEGTNFRAWMFRFVTLEIFNRNRKHEPTPLGALPGEVPQEQPWDLVTGEATFEALFEDPDAVLEYLDEAVAQALRRLPAAERSVLLLRAVGEFSYKEIHDLLAIPLGSVIGYLSRARKQLRVALADYATRQGLLPGKAEPRGPES